MQFRPRLNLTENELIKQFRNKSGIGIIGDTHEPYCIRETDEHLGYRDFCYEVFNRFGVSEILHIGDECDNAALSFHQREL